MGAAGEEGVHVSCARRNADVDRAQRPGEEVVAHEAGAQYSE